jgi:hypothetical protein
MTVDRRTIRLSDALKAAPVIDNPPEHRRRGSFRSGACKIAARAALLKSSQGMRVSAAE